jgi:hypothetical protein
VDVRVAAGSSVALAPGAGAGRPVEELARYRHDSPSVGDVESAVRAAGGFPTQGGGTRESARANHALRRRRGHALSTTRGAELRTSLALRPAGRTTGGQS